MSNPATTGRPSTGSPSYTHYNPNPNPNVSMGAKRVVVNSPVSPRPASNSVVKGGGLNNSHSNLHSSSPTQNTQYNQPSNYGNEAYDNYHDANDNGGHDPVYEQPVNNNPMGNSGHTHSFQQQRNEQYNNHGHQNPNQYHAPNQHNQQQHNQAYHQPSNLANSGNQNHHGNQPNYTANHQQQPSSLSNSAPSPTGSGHFGGSPSYSTSHSQGSLNVPPHLQQGTPSITPLSPQSHSINPNRQSSVKTMMRPHGQGSVSGSYQPVPYQPQNRVESSTISSGYQPTAYQPQAYQPQPYQPQQYHSGATNLTTASPFSAPPQNSVYYSSSGSSGGASSTAGFQPQPYQPPTSNPTSPMRSDSVSYHPPQGGSSGYHGGQQFGPLQMYPQYQHQPSTGVNPNARLSSSHGKTGQPLRVPSNTSISMSNNSGDEASLSPLPLQTQQTIQMSKENSPRQHRPSGSGMPIMGAERENGPSPRQPSPPLNSIGNSSSGSVHNTPPSQSPTSADLGILFENEAFQIGDNPQLAMQLQYISAAFSISDQGAIGSRASGDLTSSSSAVKRKSSPLTPSPNNSGSFKVANTATTTTASSVTPVDPNAHLKTMPKRVERPRHVINFKAPDDDTQVTFTQVDGKTCVKTATFSKIIEKVTATVPCIEQDDVLLCYHSFCVADEILDALILRYEEPSGEDVKTVRLRIFNFIRKWAVSYWYDWILDPSLTQKALDFLERSMDKQDQSKGGVAATVKSIIEKKQLEGDVENQRKRTTEAHSEPSIPMNLDSPGILQYDAVEIARQMTLIEWEIWSNIQHWELLGLAWTKKDKDTTAKNVCCMTDRFNLVSDWVVNVICTTDDAKHRVKVIMKFLKIADELRNMGNYNGVLEIMSGLRRGPVDRMKRSIAGACGQKPFQKIYDELDNLTNSAKAYLNMRNAIKSVNPPLIPYLGMYQTDLLMIDQGNPDEIAGLINYTKYRLSAETIKKIKQYQHINQGYNYRIVDDLYQQLLHCLSPVKLKENEQYDISNHLEPREGKEPGARPECLDRYIQASTEMRLEFFRNRKKDHGDSADQSESDRASDSSAPFIARVSKRSYPGSKKDEDKKEKDSRKSSQPLVGHRGAFNDRSSGSMTSSGTFGNPGSPSRDRDSTSEKSGGTTAASLLLSGGGNSDRGDREAALQNAGSSGSLGGNPARNSSGSIVIRDPVFASNGDHTGQVLDQYGVSHDEDNYSTLEKMIENMLIDTTLQYSTAIVACYRQCFTAQHVIQELARLYNMAKSVNGFQKTSALLRTWIIQYWKDFEDQPELLTLIDQLFGLYDQQFTLYKQKILTPTIEKQRNFSWPPVKDTVFDNLSVESLKPLDFARQLVHHTYDNFISRITINDIIAEINDTVSNPRLYNFNINEPTHQNIVFKLAQGRYAGISGIEFVIGNELKRKNTNNLIRIKKANKDDDVNINSGDQCFTGRRAVKWLHTVLNCPPNVAASWLRLFLNKNIITAVDEKKADVQDLDILWKFTSTTVPAPCNRVLQIEENELVSNFRNMLYQHLTLIQNFILREVKKEHIYKYRGAQALHDFILIAQEVQKLNNWHILLAFVTTFNQISTSPEFREIWEQLSSLDKQWFVQLRNLFTDPQELRKTLISIPSINLHNTSCTILQVLIDDLASVARRFPESPHPEIKINQKRWFELSKGLDFYTRTCSYYPPSFEKLTQIQTFFAQDLLSYSI